MSLKTHEYGTPGDPFGQISVSYRDFRPTYPSDLIEHLSSISPSNKLAWDCATGTGQVASELASYFDLVIATDVSDKQINAAKKVENIDYRVAPAEQSGLAKESVDLITVAQALHWFDTLKFFDEARRVLKPEGILAIWTYGPLVVNDKIVNSVIQDFYYNIVGPYWPEGRAHVDSGYSSIQFPFSKTIQTPAFEMAQEWTQSEFLGYLSTWSSVVKYKESVGIDPLENLTTQLDSVWHDGKPLIITWPLTIRVGRF